MEDVIAAVTQAEEKAAQKKAEAQSRAAAILEEAEARSRETLKQAEADCKRYRETELLRAEENAENAYRVAVSDKKAEAKAYAELVMKQAKPAVSRIVRRICG